MKEIELTEKTLKHWAEMTDANNHMEVRIEIAEFFDIRHKGSKYRKFADAWKEYKMVCEHARREALTASVILCDLMIDEIAREYGVEVAAAVHHCL